MPDLAMLASAIEFLDTAFDMAAALAAADEPLARQDQVRGLQFMMLQAHSRVLLAQYEQRDLVKAIDRLEADAVRAAGWRQDASRYVLRDFGGGTYAYALRPGEERDEPPHLLCARCFQAGGKSILQFVLPGRDGRRIFECHACGKQSCLGRAVPERFAATDPPEPVVRRFAAE
ncbi:MAG: hypothetical protein J0H01_20685 [Rhizobiales bacterium]|nr:hypothetical protein [Hyphomicrobiales bacterium]